MYRVADGLDPESYLALARATYAEMALAGVTAVGEFHYLHHGPGGVPYDDPNEMGRRADRRGRRRRHPHHVDRRLLPPRRDRRAAGGRPAALLRRRRGGLGGARRGAPGWGVGADRGRHPQRARGRPRRRRDRGRAGPRSTRRPLHAHVSEQPAENHACLEAYGAHPHGRARRGRRARGALHRRARHPPATTPTWRCSAARGACCCVCPTTERDLADGIGRMRRLAEAGASLSLGSDSHAVIDLFEEARAVELDERLASGERGHHTAAALLRAASEDGHACLGWPDAGRIAPGARADLVTVGARRRALGRHGAGERAPRGRVRGRRSRRAARARGRPRDRPRRPARDDRRGPGAARGRPASRGVSVLVIDNIGLLVTGEPSLGEGPLGLVRDAAVVVDGERVASIERCRRGRGRAARRRRSLRHPGIRGQPHPPRLRRRPRRRVRRPDGRPTLRGVRDQGHHRRHPSRERGGAPRARARPPRRGRAGRDHAPGDQVRLRARAGGRAPLVRGRRPS